MMTGPTIDGDWAVIAQEPRVCGTNGHGPFTANQMQHRHPLNAPWWTKCPKCDAGLQAELDMQHAAILGGMTEKQRAAIARIRAAAIPTRYHESSVWNWQHGIDQQRRVWEMARRYAGEFEQVVSTGRCFVMHGATGTGKTHLAVGLLKHVLEKGGTGHYTTAADLLARIKNTYHRDSSETEAEVTALMVGVDLLVLDEVGKNQDTAHDQSYLFRVLDKRHAESRPTIVVSNMTKLSLAKFLGEPLLDRLRENGGHFATFDWASQRSSRKPRQDDDA